MSAELDALCEALTGERNDDKANELIVAIRLALHPRHSEELRHLIDHGPVWDGDAISKAGRDDLLRWKLAARVMVKGRWGFTAATYRGGHVMGDHIEVTS